MTDPTEAGRRYAEVNNEWNDTTDALSAFGEWEQDELTQEEADAMTSEQYRTLMSSFMAAYRSVAGRKSA
jgi:hypothetical protein